MYKELGFVKLAGSGVRDRSKRLDTLASGGTTAKTFVSAEGDSAASYKNKHFNISVKKPAGGVWSRNGKVMASQKGGSQNFNTIARHITNSSKLNTTVIDTTLNRNLHFK